MKKNKIDFLRRFQITFRLPEVARKIIVFLFKTVNFLIPASSGDLSPPRVRHASFISSPNPGVSEPTEGRGARPRSAGACPRAPERVSHLLCAGAFLKIQVFPFTSFFFYKYNDDKN